MPEASRTMLAAYTVAAGLALLAVGRWVGLREHSGGAPPAVRAAAVVPAVTAPRGAGRVVVHVAGAVRHAGVYRLATGARVRDAVNRAGGPSRAADPAGVNLAAKLADGQQVIVPRKVSRVAPAAGPGTGEGGASGPVSLNAATAEQLDGLDGVGPATADKILAWRREHGGFASVDDLGQIPGIGPKKLETLRGQVTP